MIRILGGSAKGRNLRGPKGLSFRPTTGRVKEFVFSVIGSKIEGAKVLDCFCGTGSLGIEALSRSANRIVFIDRSAESLKILRKNLELCNFTDRAKITRGDFFYLIKKIGSRGDRFDYIFADPPFKEFMRGRIVSAVGESRVLEKDGFLFLEHEFHDPEAEQYKNLEILRQKRFGHCVISIYSQKDSG